MAASAFVYPTGRAFAQAAPARRLLAIATEELPRHWHTLLLRAYVLAYDDDAPGSLRAVKHCCDRP